MEGGGIV
jgi:hypothetical protein